MDEAARPRVLFNAVGVRHDRLIQGIWICVGRRDRTVSRAAATLII